MAAFDWWIPNHTAATATSAASHQNQSGRARSATFCAVSTAHTAVKMASPSFQEATEPSTPSGSRRPSSGRKAAAKRMPRCGRRAIPAAIAIPTSATSSSGSRPSTVAPAMARAMTAHRPYGPPWENRPRGPVRRARRAVVFIHASGCTRRSVQGPSFGGFSRTRSGVRFEEQVRVVWRQRFWLLGFSLLAAIIVFIAVSMRDTTYTTSAVLGVTPGPVIAGNAVAVDTVSFTASRYQRLVSADSVLTSGAAVADKGTTLPDMRERVTASTATGSGTVTVTVTGANADETARVAAAVANATIAQGKSDQEKQRNDSLTALRAERDTLRTQLDTTAADALERAQLESQYQSVVSDIAAQQSAPFDDAQLLQTPEVPRGPTGPGPKSLALFAFLAVLIVGAEGIVIWTRRKQRLDEVPEPAVAEFAPATFALEEASPFTTAAEAEPDEAVDPATHVPLLPLVA